MPYSAAIHPDLAEASTDTRRWLDRFELLASERSRVHQLERTRPELMAARYYPEVGHAWLLLLSRWLGWAFIVDDELDDGPAGRDAETCRRMIEMLTEVVDHDVVAEHPLAKALKELWQATPRGRSPAWNRRFTNGFTDWLWSYHTESLQRTMRRHPSMSDYLSARRITCAMLWFADLIEPAHGIQIPEAVRTLPDWHRVRAAATEHIGLINDMFSHRKERELDYIHNAVLLTEQHGGHDTPDALSLVNDMATERINRIEAAAESMDRYLETAAVADQTKHAVVVAFDGYRALVRGNLDWHWECGRYTAPEAIEGGTPDYTGALSER